jgi:hypothetical protein
MHEVSVFKKKIPAGNFHILGTDLTVSREKEIVVPPFPVSLVSLKYQRLVQFTPGVDQDPDLVHIDPAKFTVLIQGLFGSPEFKHFTILSHVVESKSDSLTADGVGHPIITTVSGCGVDDDNKHQEYQNSNEKIEQEV